MPQPAIFRALAYSDNLAADDALIAALPEAELQAQERIVEAVLIRRKPTGLMGLVAYYHKLDNTLQQRILGACDRLYGALRDCRAVEEPEARLNIIDIILKAKQYRLAYLLTSLLRDRAPRVREAAAVAIRTLTGMFLTEIAQLRKTTAETGLGDSTRRNEVQNQLQHWVEDRHLLTEALAEGLEWFDTHLHPTVVEAAMWMVDDLKERIWDKVNDKSNRVRHAVLEILTRPFEPWMTSFVIECLTRDGLRSTVLRRLGSPLADETLDEWLNQSWRFADPAWRESLRMTKQWPSLVSAFEQLDRWNESQLTQALNLAMQTGLTTSSRIGIIMHALQQTSTASRRAAVWALCEMPETEATAVLQTIAESGEQPLVAIARRELRRRSRLETASTAEQAGHAAAIHALSDLEKLWRSFDAMSPQARETEAVKALSIHENLVGLIESKLSNADTTIRLKALRILTVGRCVYAAEETLYGLAHDPDPKLRSAAMKALSQLKTATSERLLRQGLTDTDERVRANAVESLESLKSVANEPLVREKLNDPNNRTRANAAKALLKCGVRQAAETLVAMLRDPAREQRISALWAVNVLQIAPLLKRIHHLAYNDPDLLVRHKARQILDLMEPVADGNPEHAEKEAVPSTT